ncbi:MAG: hypothetical protein QGH60_00420 [Phycisphaerae bacterium]|jgi:hypothetical protein|nr:hypothetical protein [Phycisphaerae bacterium]
MIERHEHNRYDKPRPKVTLLVHDRDSFGLLKLQWPDVTIKLRLECRHCRVLLALEAAMRADAELDDAFRGLRTNSQVADAYAQGQGDPYAYTPGPKAIAAYRAQIHRLIRSVMPEGLKAPRLIETVRTAGVRLMHNIEIVDLSARHT